MPVFYLFLVCLLLGTAQCAVVLEGNYNVTAYCTSVRPGTKLASIVACDRYYLCTSSEAVLYICPAGYLFNLAEQNCWPAAQVACGGNPCSGLQGHNWVGSPNNCRGWIYCSNDNEAGSGTCSSSQSFNPARQTCENVPCTNSEPNLQNKCQVVPPGIYFGNTANCSDWYYCATVNKLYTGSCPAVQTAFDVTQQQCTSHTPAVCARVVPPPVPCSRQGDKQADGSVCGTYYVCNGKYYEQQTCGYGYYFDTLRLACIERQVAVAAPGCDRCQYASQTFVNAVDRESCRKYLYCYNGKGSLASCPAGSYFNEDWQTCTSESSLSAYAARHGACYGVVVTTTARPTTTTSTTVAPTSSSTTESSSTESSSTPETSSSSESTVSSEATASNDMTDTTTVTTSSYTTDKTTENTTSDGSTDKTETITSNETTKATTSGGDTTSAATSNKPTETTTSAGNTDIPMSDTTSKGTTQTTTSSGSTDIPISDTTSNEPSETTTSASNTDIPTTDTISSESTETTTSDHSTDNSDTTEDTIASTESTETSTSDSNTDIPMSDSTTASEQGETSTSVGTTDIPVSDTTKEIITSTETSVTTTSGSHTDIPGVSDTTEGTRASNEPAETSRSTDIPEPSAMPTSTEESKGSAHMCRCL